MTDDLELEHDPAADDGGWCPACFGPADLCQARKSVVLNRFLAATLGIDTTQETQDR